MVYRYPAGDPLHPETLKETQRLLREGFQTPLTLRVHRALSLLRPAEAEDVDHDVRFILLACYQFSLSRSARRLLKYLDYPSMKLVLHN